MSLMLLVVMSSFTLVPNDKETKTKTKDVILSSAHQYATDYIKESMILKARFMFVRTAIAINMIALQRPPGSEDCDPYYPNCSIATYTTTGNPGNLQVYICAWCFPDLAPAQYCCRKPSEIE